MQIPNNRAQEESRNNAHLGQDSCVDIVVEKGWPLLNATQLMYTYTKCHEV